MILSIALNVLMLVIAAIPAFALQAPTPVVIFLIVSIVAWMIAVLVAKKIIASWSSRDVKHVMDSLPLRLTDCFSVSSRMPS